MPIQYAESLSFLLSQLGAHTARRFAGELDGTGLTPRAFGVLSNVADLGPRSQQQLADELGMHRNNMVALVDELEGVGFARRVRNPEDRRSFRIEATAEGRRATQRAMAIVTRLDEELARALTDSDAVALTDLLRDVSRDAGLAPGVHPHLSGRREPPR